MNNKITAIAVAAALTAPMFAVEAAPQVYGRVQAEYASTSNSATGTTDKDYVVDNKMGRFGFKGSEDLGGGLKAIYLIEFGIEGTNTTSGGTSGGDIFDRESMVGLKIGKNHTIQAGALKSPYKYSGGVKYDSFVATSLQAREGSTNVGASGGAMSGSALGHGSFLSDSVAYIGNFKPVKVWFATSALDDSTDDTPVTTLAVSAKVNAFHFGVSLLERDTCTAATGSNCTGTTTGIESTKLFGSWSKGQHTVRLQLEDVDTQTAAGVNSGNTEFMYLNYQFKMGKHLVDVAVGEKDQDATAGNVDEDYTRLAYAYNFSKKTRVFAGIAESDVSTSGANDWDTFSVGMTVKF